MKKSRRVRERAVGSERERKRVGERKRRRKIVATRDGAIQNQSMDIHYLTLKSGSKQGFSL